MHDTHERGDSVTTTEAFASLVRTAVKSGHANLLQQHRCRIIERIMELATCIIDTTSVVLEDTPLKVERHVLPTFNGSTSTRTDRGSSSSDMIMKKNRGGTHSAQCPLSNPVLSIPKGASRKRKGKQISDIMAERSKEIGEKIKYQGDDGKTGSGHNSNLTRAALVTNEAAAFSVPDAHQTPSSLHKWLSEVMYPTGLCDSGPLFGESNDLTDDEVHTILMQLRCNTQTSPSSYRKLLRVHSLKVASSSETILQDFRSQSTRSKCFTMSFYACQTADNIPISKETSVTSLKEMKRGKQGISTCITPTASALIRRPHAKSISFVPQPGKVRQTNRHGSQSHERSPSFNSEFSLAECGDIQGVDLPVVTWNPIVPSLREQGLCNANEAAGWMKGVSVVTGCEDTVALFSSDKAAERVVLQGREQKTYTLHFVSPHSGRGIVMGESLEQGGVTNPIELSVASTESPAHGEPPVRHSVLTGGNRRK